VIYKTLHRKLKIEQHEPHLKPEVNSSALGGKAIPPPHTCGTCHDTLVTILMMSQAKFGSNWQSHFREEDVQIKSKVLFLQA